MTTTLDQREYNDTRGLLWLQKFGWMRARELGIFMFPKYRPESQRAAASRLLTSWQKRNLVLLRTLPDGAGKAAVLSLPGARFLRERGYKADSGKDLGHVVDVKLGKMLELQPGYPAEQEQTLLFAFSANPHHDLIATGVLALLHQQGYEVICERELRGIKNEGKKLPDGIARAPDKPSWIWIEVENARKTGEHLNALGKALALAAAGEIPKIGEFHCEAGMVAYCDTKDERGYLVDHRKRVIKAVSEHTKKPIKLAMVCCKAHGQGIDSLRIDEALVEPEKAISVLRYLDRAGWILGERETLSSKYGDHTATIWKMAKDHWCWLIDEQLASDASSISEAKLLCARAISLLNEDA